MFLTRPHERRLLSAEVSDRRAVMIDAILGLALRPDNQVVAVGAAGDPGGVGSAFELRLYQADTGQPPLQEPADCTPSRCAK